MTTDTKQEEQEMKLRKALSTPKFVLKGIPFYWGGDERKKLLEDGMAFKFRPDDILIVGFPRSGKL